MKIWTGALMQLACSGIIVFLIFLYFIKIDLLKKTEINKIHQMVTRQSWSFPRGMSTAV